MNKNIGKAKRGHHAITEDNGILNRLIACWSQALPWKMQWQIIRTKSMIILGGCAVQDTRILKIPEKFPPVGPWNDGNRIQEFEAVDGKPVLAGANSMEVGSFENTWRPTSLLSTSIIPHHGRRYWRNCTAICQGGRRGFHLDDLMELKPSLFGEEQGWDEGLVKMYDGCCHHFLS